MQALYGVLLKSTCAFSVECPIFPGKHHYLKVLGTKNYISFKVCYSVLISLEKKFYLALLNIKFTPICTLSTVSLNMIKIYRNDD